ncbi:unnamed protein product [Urochloa humidicola]
MTMRPTQTFSPSTTFAPTLSGHSSQPTPVLPQGFVAGRLCPALRCAADLAAECPTGARAPGGACSAGGTEAGLFKAMCPETRMSATDVEATPQDCVASGELKVVFCWPTQDSVGSHQ